ncbi:MAG: aminoglycoside N3'-acetyltransferase [Psychromonas sp.]|jgi:aminoglycoside N3'-acetyltransferase|uniref:AAC(3) family N-acetyltransferase n=1 Tax=Psychromonas sp. TaxID=1884585 RepID=UPI0039E68E3D
MTINIFQSNINQENLIQSFVEFGINKGDCLEVHSSLSSFGYIEGGAVSVVNALMAAVGANGLLLMSAFYLSKALPLIAEDHKNEINLKLNILNDRSEERSGMGVIVDEFLTRDDVVTSTGVFRLAAWGRDAQDYIDNGFAEVVSTNTKTLLLGVNYDKCSSLHQSEDIALPNPLKNHLTLPDSIRQQYSKELYIGYRDTFEVHFINAGQQAEQQGLVQKKQIGSAQCKLFYPKDIVEILRGWRKKSPYWLMGYDELKVMNHE